MTVRQRRTAVLPLLCVAVAGLVNVPPAPLRHSQFTASRGPPQRVVGGVNNNNFVARATLESRAPAASSSLSVPPVPIANEALELTSAERARTTAEQGISSGLALSTLRAEEPDMPWTSYADYVLDAAGRPVVLLRDGAEHTKNLESNERASVLVQARRTDGRRWVASSNTRDADGNKGNVASETAADRSRVTMVGSLRRLEETSDETDMLKTKFSVRHAYADALLNGDSSSSSSAGAADFALWRLEPRSVFFVGGFGVKARWVDARDYSDALPDVVASGATDLVNEMNGERHASDRSVAARQLLGVDDATGVAIVHVDSLGVDVRVSRDNGVVEEYRVAYRTATKPDGTCSKPTSVEDAKSELNKLFQEAWEADQGLQWDGWYDTKPHVFKYATTTEDEV